MATYTASGSSSPINVTAPAGTYTATVTAHNTAGNSPVSNSVSVTISAPTSNGSYDTSTYDGSSTYG